jgi:hypothetical protein
MESPQELQRVPPSVAVEIIRLSIWLLLLMVIFVPPEKLFAKTPQKLRRRGLMTDLGYYFINSLAPKAVLVGREANYSHCPQAQGSQRWRTRGTVKVTF